MTLHFQHCPVCDGPVKVSGPEGYDFFVSCTQCPYRAGDGTTRDDAIAIHNEAVLAMERRVVSEATRNAPVLEVRGNKWTLPDVGTGRYALVLLER